MRIYVNLKNMLITIKMNGKIHLITTMFQDLGTHVIPIFHQNIKFTDIYNMQHYTWIWYPPFDNHIHDLVQDFSIIQMLLLHWWCQSCTKSWEQTWKAKNSQSILDGCLLALVAFPWILSSPLQGCAPTSSMDCNLLIFRNNGLPKNKATLRLFSIPPSWRGTSLPHSKIVHSIWLPPEWEGHGDKWNRQGEL